MTLEMILYITLQSAMGLYRFGVLASFSLGIRVIMVAFSALRMEADLLDAMFDDFPTGFEELHSEAI